jgi:hypothetical protein
MVRKIKLDSDYGNDIAIVGISCHKQDYWITLRLNEALHLKLTHQPKDLKVFDPERSISLDYPIFHYTRPDTMESYHIIPNHNPEGKLFPDQKSFDYFILIKGRLKNEELSVMIAEIKKIPNVLTAHKLNLKKIKNLQEFISDLELFMIEMAGRKKKRF